MSRKEKCTSATELQLTISKGLTNDNIVKIVIRHVLKSRTHDSWVDKRPWRQVVEDG